MAANSVTLAIFYLKIKFSFSHNQSGSGHSDITTVCLLAIILNIQPFFLTTSYISAIRYKNNINSFCKGEIVVWIFFHEHVLQESNP